MRYNDSLAIVDDIPLLSQWIKKDQVRRLGLFWQGWQDLNLRMTESKSVALPLGYIPKKNGVEDRNRTDDLQGHNLAL